MYRFKIKFKVSKNIIVINNIKVDINSFDLILGNQINN